MESLMNAVLLMLNMKIILSSPAPLPILVPKACNLTVWMGNSDVTAQRVSVLDGDTINLICDARCTNEHYTPALKWINPKQRIIWDMPGRIFTAPMSSHRLQRLYIQDINQNDIGTYQCEGWIGRWTDVKVEIGIGPPTEVPRQRTKRGIMDSNAEN